MSFFQLLHHVAPFPIDPQDHVPCFLTPHPLRSKILPRRDVHALPRAPVILCFVNPAWTTAIGRMPLILKLSLLKAIKSCGTHKYGNHLNTFSWSMSAGVQGQTRFHYKHHTLEDKMRQTKANCSTHLAAPFSFSNLKGLVCGGCSGFCAPCCQINQLIDKGLVFRHVFFYIMASIKTVVATLVINIDQQRLCKGMLLGKLKVFIGFRPCMPDIIELLCQAGMLFDAFAGARALRWE